MSRRRVMMMLFGFSVETKEFISRIEADGGIVESPNCIDKKLKADYYADLTQLFIDRVIADSGKYEAAQCIDEKLQLT
tara:strand:- start:1287 stop:1520 length:234 start_codon:yes stop_codon:yes gene_type:complete